MGRRRAHRHPSAQRGDHRLRGRSAPGRLALTRGAPPIRVRLLALGLLPAALSGCVEELCRAGELCVEVGSGEAGFNGDGLPALETDLYLPSAVFETKQGELALVDFNNMKLRYLAADGTVGVLVGSGFHAYSVPGTAPLDTPLENPVDAAWGPDGALYIAPLHEGRILRIPDGGTVEVVAGTGFFGDSGDGGPALEAEMENVAGLAWGPDGSLYFSDQARDRVRRLSPEGTVEAVAGGPDAEPGRTEGAATRVPLLRPRGLAWDAAGERLLVADAGHHRVVAIDPEAGTLSLLAGTGELGRAGDGGPALEAELNAPDHALPLPDGGVLIADRGNAVLRRVDPDGTIETVAGTGERDAAGAPRSAPPLEQVLVGPGGLAAAADGSVLVADASGHRVLRWRP